MKTIKAFYSKLSSKLQNERLQNVLYILAPFVILTCLALGLLAYINIVPGFASKFYVGTTLGTAVRALSFFILFIYSILCVISLRLKLNYKLVVVYIILMFMNFIMIFASPHQYETLFLSQYYRIGEYFVTSVSYKNILISFMSSVVDFLWGFCFLWVLPLLFKNKKQILLVLLPFILIMLITCIYSFIFERKIFILVFTDPSQIGSATGLQSMFDTKQTFGVFLCPAFCCSLLSIKLVLGKDPLFRYEKLVLGIPLIISALIIFFVSIVSLCRTAIVANFIALFVFYIALTVHSFHLKKKIIGIVLSSALVIFILIFVLFMTIDSLHSSGILNNLYKFLMQHIFNRIQTSSDSRLAILVAYLREIPLLNLFFGFSKGLSDIYIRSLAPILIYGLHSGFAIYLNNYGLISFFITYLFIISIVWKNLKNIKKDPFIAILIFGFFITVMFLNISESEILVFSSSTIVFMFNFLIIVFANSRYLKDKYYNM